MATVGATYQLIAETPLRVGRNIDVPAKGFVTVADIEPEGYLRKDGNTPLVLFDLPESNPTLRLGIEEVLFDMWFQVVEPV